MRPVIRRRIFAALCTVTMLLLSLASRVGAEQLGVTLPAPVGSTLTQGGAPNFSDSFITPFVAVESGTIVSWKAQFYGGRLVNDAAGVPAGIQLKVLRSISGTQVQVIGAGSVHDPRPALQTRFGTAYPFFLSAEAVLQFSENLPLSPGDIIGVTISADPVAGGYVYPLVGIPEGVSRIVARDVGLGGIIDLSDLFTGTFAGLAPSIEVLTVAASRTLQVDSVHGVVTDASPCPGLRDSGVYKTIRLSLFDSTATKISCASRSATLTGRTLAGNLFQGSDSVRPVGCNEGR
jgi:hypothetical protein